MRAIYIADSRLLSNQQFMEQIQKKHEVIASIGAQNLVQVLESKTNIAAFVLPLLSAETRLIKAIRTHKIYAKALIVVSEEIIEGSVKTNLYEQHIKTYISPLDDGTLNARILESAIDMYRRFMDQYNQLELYRTIENGGTFTLLVNDEWKLLYANDKYYEFIGYTPESFQKLCANSVKKITYPQDVAPLKQNIEAVLAKGEERFDTQTRIVTHAGEIKHCLIKSAFATRNDQTVINGILLDITKEMKTEQKLSALIENIPGGVAVVEISPNQTKPTYLSDGFFNLLGYKREEYFSLILDNSICMVHPDDTALVLKAIENSLKNNTAFNCTYRFKHKNGKYQWINFAASPVERLDDKSIYYGLYTDVSKEKEANLNLRKANNRLNAIMENLDGGIVILKYQHEKITPEFFSNGFNSLMKSTQCDISSLYGEDAYAGVHPDDMQRVKGAFQYAIKNISSVNESYRLRNEKNEYVWINVRAVPLKESDDALFFYCIYTNITKERELLEKAIVSEQTIKIAVEQAKINVWTLDIAKRTIELSEENNMTKDMDYSLLVDVPDTLIKEGVIFEDDIPSIKEMFERIYAGQDRAECIARWRKDDNKDYIWVKTTCTTVFDKMGIPIKAIGTSINITEQKKLEQQYRDFEAYQYLMADDSLSTFKVNVTQDKIEEAIHFEQGIKSLIDIQNMSEFFEKSNHNIPNETHKKLHREFYNRENLLKAFEEGQTHLTLECQYYIEPDVCHWLRMPINLAQNPDTGDVIGFTYATDIDDEKLMQMVMDDMIHHDYDLIMCVYVDTDYYRILAQSENAPFALDESLTYFKDQALDVIHKHVHPDDQQMCIDNLDRKNVLSQLETNPSYEFVVRMRSEDGQLQNKRLHFSYLDKERRMLLHYREDITKLVAAEQQKNELLNEALHGAEQANHAKSIFLSSMSHDIRTPLNAIIGMTKVAQMDTANMEQISESLKVIGTSSEHLLNIINDILDMSQIESGNMTLSNETMDLNLECSRVADIIAPIIHRKSQNFQFKTNIINPFCIGDAHRLNRILINLLNNASKFTPEGGKIRFTVYESETDNAEVTNVHFVVADNGMGIESDKLDKIFEPFYRSGISAINQVEGTGLGLSIVNSIVKARGGTIDVESELGKGATFTVILPLRIDLANHKSKHSIKQPQSTSLNLSGKVILLVEDHPVNQLVATRLLEKYGAKVCIAENGLVGAEKFEQSIPSEYDFIFMDVQMPVMDGYEATRTIRRSKHVDAKSVPIIAMTANAFPEDVQKCLSAGMNGHIGKPISVEAIAQELSKL